MMMMMMMDGDEHTHTHTLHELTSFIQKKNNKTHKKIRKSTKIQKKMDIEIIKENLQA